MKEAEIISELLEIEANMEVLLRRQKKLRMKLSAVPAQKKKKGLPDSELQRIRANRIKNMLRKQINN